MATLTVKDVPDTLLVELRRVAAEQRRSLNSEIIYRLERSLTDGRASAKAFISSLDAIHARLDIPPLTTEEIRGRSKTGGSDRC